MVSGRLVSYSGYGVLLGLELQKDGKGCMRTTEMSKSTLGGEVGHSGSSSCFLAWQMMNIVLRKEGGS